MINYFLNLKILIIENTGSVKNRKNTDCLIIEGRDNITKNFKV